ncbi:hypothetical protein NVP1287O_03 [Vibrio phage 1.287.O._10N.286.55.C7]|nr:hypothetical protein NVP1287O_03 [Vibrio phage 1.287.O._10N.286.55.C7]
MSDVYEKIQYKGERPEYVLKNGKAINVYGMLIDVHLMQDEIAELREALGSMVSLIDAIWIEQAFTQDKDKSIVNYSKAKQLLNK